MICVIKMAKKEQSYRNDDKVFFVEKWFDTHQTLTKENYDMLKSMVHYMRGK